MNRRFLLALAALLFFGDVLVAQELDWTNKKGQTLRADYLGVEKGMVLLQKAGGKTFQYPVSQLNAASIEQLNELIKNAPKVSNFRSIPAVFQQRFSKQSRDAKVKALGGDPEAVETAILNGLDWIKSNQDPAAGSLGSSYPAAITGLSLLAFLGHGETAESELYGDPVVKATLYLMDRAIKNKGMMDNGESGLHSAYEHGIAAYALAELHAIEEGADKVIPRLESVVKKACGIIEAGQASSGGWVYGYSTRDNAGDTCLSCWQMQSLFAARLAGVNERGASAALEKGAKFFEGMQAAEGSFLYTPSSKTGKFTLTALSLLSLKLAGAEGNAAYAKGRQYMEDKMITFQPPYYQVFFDIGWGLSEAGAHAEKANKAIQTLIATQQADGSWKAPTSSTYAKEDGAVMNTAMGVLMLESYYRHDWDKL